MTTATRADLVELEAAFDRAERVRLEAAEAERAAYQRWQDCYGAYEVASGDASKAWHAWAGAVVG
jgi:hypothetical protein